MAINPQRDRSDENFDRNGCAVVSEKQIAFILFAILINRSPCEMIDRDVSRSSLRQIFPPSNRVAHASEGYRKEGAARAACNQNNATFFGYELPGKGSLSSARILSALQCTTVMAISQEKERPLKGKRQYREIINSLLIPLFHGAFAFINDLTRIR